MAKRFTASDKWEDSWFRKLPLKSKLFWLFLIDRCDVAGVWKIDYELASFCIGEAVDESILSDFTSRFEKINSDKLWIVRFVEFQYGDLSEDCNPHKPVISILKRYGLYLRVKKGFIKGSLTLKDKDQDKDKVKDQDKRGSEEGEFPVVLNTTAFQSAWLDWQKHRKEKRHPLTPTTIKRQLAQLATMGLDRAVKAIEHSILNGWQGIFEPDEQKQGKTTTPPRPVPLCDQWTRARNIVLDKLNLAVKQNGDIPRTLSACRDQFRDMPKYNGEDAVTAAYEIFQHQREVMEKTK